MVAKCPILLSHKIKIEMAAMRMLFYVWLYIIKVCSTFYDGGKVFRLALLNIEISN